MSNPSPAPAAARRVPPIRACKSQKLGKDKWRGKYQDGSRFSPHTKEFPTKKAADDWAGKQVAALENGTHVTTTAAKKTLGPWCDEWLELQTCKLSTKKLYRWALNVILTHFGKDTPVSQIQERHHKAFLIHLSGRYKFDTAIMVNKILGRVLGEAHRNGLTPTCVWSPSNRVAAPVAFDYDDEEHDTDDQANRYYPTTEQVWQIYDTIAEPYRVAVLLGAFIGLRISETAGARIEDIRDDSDDDNPLPVFHPKRQWIRPGCRPTPDKVYGPLKTPACRKTVPVPPPIADMIGELTSDRTSGQIVLREDGQPATPTDINNAITEAVTAIGGDLARLRFHGLRHYLASIAIANGEDIATVCDRMRHKNPTITLKTYTHLVKAAERRATDAIGREAMRGRKATPLAVAA
ncbi:tyrosine-type recombinase/integrase [Nocardia bovistercoris]|uniref:Tyrosine-type recombinase/integrase n=1 Tax=Nocardia bovistercoris TaxID=2785916 RepID=A0A931N4D3_9NOCA|nr:tyrosine-type recombinase/integrase [Nocardia bovistercoris]MBH0778744.1 tyrosine-type recombinase/integrase [Nocardia bovistercoris]